MQTTSKGEPLSKSDPAMPLPKRRFLGNRYVYCVLSQRAGGLSVGINMNPDQFCNFGCVYCEVDRSNPKRQSRINVDAMIVELDQMLGTIHSGRLEDLGYSPATPELFALKEVAFSGDGEPTLSPAFREAVEAVVHLRARHRFPFFKLVLITNTTGLGLPDVRAGLELFSPEDEVWAKLDAGTQEYMDLVNAADISLEQVIQNILDFAINRPVVIQSLFPMINGTGPSRDEVLAYAHRLKELKEQGARIKLVQVYSAHRPAIDAVCGHLPLRMLSEIARTVRKVAGLRAEVF